MKSFKLGVIETEFAKMIWDHAPVRSGELVKLAAEAFSWKKPTTYTVLRKLCEKGLFRNEDSIVTPIISLEEFYAIQGEEIIEEGYGGSLPVFIAAFAARKPLSEKEINEIQSIIRAAKGS